jgi:methionine synthase II (cobalamin-independent)
VAILGGMPGGSTSPSWDDGWATGAAADLRPGLATSIGSLPHTDPRAATTFVLERHPRLPAAPSLPNRSGVERMIAQAAWGIRGIDVLCDGSLRVDDPSALDPRAPLADPGIDGEPFVALRAFLGAVTGRRGPIKLQLTGPLTLGIALHSVGVPARTAFAVAGAAVRARARSLLAATREVAPMAPLVVFVDEPSLTAAMHPGFPLDPDRTIDLVSSALATLEPHAVTGLHCCGPADWRMVLQTGPQILSLPLDAGAVDHAGAIGAFLERDGWIAWGAVPTDRPLGDSASHWWRELSAEWCSLVQAGCDPVRIRRQALVTPACGLALHHLPQVERVHELSRALGLRIHDQLAGVRLSVGA